MEQTQSVKSLLVYVGTYTQTMGHVAGQATGIYVYRMDVDNGALSFVSETPGVEKPSFLALHPNGRYLYAVNELGEYAGKPGGSVSAFARDPQSGALTLLNTQPSHGGAPWYVNVDYTGKYVVLTNYAGGNVAMYPVQADGGLGAASDTVQHYGSSVDPQRQTAPYAHSVNIDLDNRYALVADLGIDKVMVYRLDLEQGKLVPNDTPFAPLQLALARATWTSILSGSMSM